MKQGLESGLAQVDRRSPRAPVHRTSLGSAPAAIPLRRFQSYLPIAHFVVNNVWLLLPVFAFFAVVVGTRSIHYGLSVMCVWMGLACFWVDRKHLDFCLFTPLQPMAQILIMGLGVGVSMVIFESEEPFRRGMVMMQLVGLGGFPLFMLGYYLVTSKVPGFVFPRLETPGVASLVKPLVIVGWLILAHELVRVVVGVISGAGDRGAAGDFLIDRPFGWWSLFGVFLRIQTLGYLLVPLIWREGRVLSRVAVASVVFCILFLHFVAASRGQVFFPIFIILVGCYMFLEIRRMKYEIILLVGLLGLAPLVTIMAHYRSTEAFRYTDIRNIFAKLAAVGEGIERMRMVEETSGEKYSEAGRAFIGVADEIVYDMTPEAVAHEGFGRIDHLIWTFIPYIFTQGERPVLQDGYMIVSYYRGYMQERTSIGITWGCEMYRRWGWAGVPIGLFLYGLFYGTVFRYVYRFYLFKNALWGFMMCGLLFHFFIAWFFHTVLTTFWFWFYDIPKHLVLLGAMYWTVKVFCRVKAPPGALELFSRAGAAARAVVRRIPLAAGGR